jgi:hypothetical protein
MAFAGGFCHCNNWIALQPAKQDKDFGGVWQTLVLVRNGGPVSRARSYAGPCE